VRITVFGASGKVGRLVVWEILRRGHQVHAFVHSRNPFEGQEEVTVVNGEVADTVAVHAALADSDAVVSTLGGWGKTSSDVLATGMTTIIPAMQALHLTRIVTLTGAGAR
jgi:putative NADH-flavin reductase